MAHVAEVQPVALHIQRLDVPAAIRHQEELALLEDGPLEDGPGLYISHVDRDSILELDDFLAGFADADELDGRFQEHFQAAHVGLGVGGQVVPSRGRR